MKKLVEVEWQWWFKNIKYLTSVIGNGEFRSGEKMTSL